MNVHEGFAEIETGNNCVLNGPGKAGSGFFNSSQKMNRDLTVLLVSHLKPKHYLDAFGGTGIRGIRISLETGSDAFISEKMKSSCDIIRNNLKKNGLSIKVYNGDFSTVVRELDFDFIDIDPYGNAVPYIDDAIKYLNKPGYIGITATDLSALTGSAPAVNLRRYGSKLSVDYYLHESGIRNLIAYVARRAAVYDCWIKVILSLWRSHYYRIVVKVFTGAKEANAGLQKIRLFDKSKISINSTGLEGPIWLSNIEDSSILSSLKIPDYMGEKELLSMVELLSHEDEIVMFYDSRDIFSGSSSLRPLSHTFEVLRNKTEKNVYRTHFSFTGFKIVASLTEVIRAVS